MTFSFPSHACITGQWCDLEPVGLVHLDEQWEVCNGEASSFANTRYGPYPTIDALRAQLTDFATREHQPFWAVRPKTSGRAEGWLSICDVDQEVGAFEIGAIWYAPCLQRTAAATEAITLLLHHGFETHHYARAVWRCYAHNAASRRAAARYGFQPEGIWREGGRLDGIARDVCWYSILAREWPNRRNAMASWLAASNFDTDGRARSSLSHSMENKA